MASHAKTIRKYKYYSRGLNLTAADNSFYCDAGDGISKKRPETP